MLELSILFILLVLLSIVCKPRLTEYMAPDCDIHRYHSIGGANLSTVINARGVCIRNVGNGPLRFSKLGFYQTIEDAQSNQRELLGQSQSTVQLYTAGITNLRGSGVEFEPSSSYVDISTVNNITLLPNTSIVIDFTTDVSFRVVRLGKLDQFTDPTACRLQLSTSSRYQTIADADFTVPKFMTFPSGDTQSNAFLKADGSHVSPNGIFVVSTLSFSDIRASNVVVVPAPTPMYTQAPAPQSVSVPSLDLAAARTRFLYTESQGVAGGVRKVLREYPDHVLFQVVESPAMVQRQDFLFRLTINSDQLIGTNGSVVLAKITVEENNPGDPSIFYRNGEIYGTQQWDDRTTQFAAVTLGGTMNITYLSDTTKQNAYLRASSNKFDTKVGARCGMWATGSNDQGKMHFVVHKCVSRAELIWSDTGLSTPASHTPCLSSLS